MPRITELPAISLIENLDAIPVVDISENVTSKMTFSQLRTALQESSGGILAISGGGTGADNAGDALQNLGGAPSDHTHSASSVGADPVGTAAAAIAAHVAQANPHTQYTSISEVNAAVAAHSSLTNNPHSVTYIQVGAEAAGVAATLIANHTAAGNPHPQYMTNGQISLLYAPLDHTHAQYLTQSAADLLYAAIGHNHSGVYAPVAHNHDSVYAAIGHNHTGVYSPVGHDHAGVYATVSHNHGTGTIGKIAKWTTTSTFADSLISESGSTVTVAGTVAATAFTGDGSALTGIAGGLTTGLYKDMPLPGTAGVGKSYYATDNNTFYLSSGSNTRTSILPNLGGAWIGIYGSRDGKYLLTGVTFNGNLRVSSDYGKNWSNVGIVSSWDYADCSEDGRVMIAANRIVNQEGYIYVSTDYGATWVQRSSINSDIRGVAVNSDGSLLVVMAGGFNLYKSTDGGLNWSTLVGSGSGAPRFLYMSRNGQIMYTFNSATAPNVQILKSVDGGANWTNTGQTTTQYKGHISYDGLAFYAANNTSGVRYTLDGTNWATMLSGVCNATDVAVSEDGKVVFVGSYTGSNNIISLDGGASQWQTFSAGGSGDSTSVYVSADGLLFLSGLFASSMLWYRPWYKYAETFIETGHIVNTRNTSPWLLQQTFNAGVLITGSAPSKSLGNNYTGIGAGIVASANAGDVQLRLGNGADLDTYGYDIGRQGATTGANTGFLRFMARQIGYGGYTFQNQVGELFTINNAGLATHYGTVPTQPTASAVQIGGGAALLSSSDNGGIYLQALARNNSLIMDNSRYEGSGFKALSTGPGSLIQFSSGELYYYSAASASAGAAHTFVRSFKIGANGVAVFNGTGSPAAPGAGEVHISVGQVWANDSLWAFDGTTRAGIFLGAGTGYTGTQTNHPFVIRTNATDRMYIANTGEMTFYNSVTLTKSAANVFLQLSSSGGSGRDWVITSQTNGELVVRNDLTADLIKISAAGGITALGAGAFVNARVYGSANPYIVFDDGTGAGYIEALSGHFIFTPRSTKWCVFAGSAPSTAGTGEVKIGGGEMNLAGDIHPRNVAYVWPAAAAAGILWCDASGNLSWITAGNVGGTGTSGKLAAWTSATTIGDSTIIDTSSGNITYARTNNPTGYHQNVAFTNTSSVQVVNTASESSIFSMAGIGTKTLPANFWVPGRRIRITIRGTISNTGTPTFTIKLKNGSTSILSSGGTAMPSIVTQGFIYTAEIVCSTSGSPANLHAHHSFAFGTDQTNFGAMKETSKAVSFNPSSVNTMPLDVTVQFGTASLSNIVTVYLACLEVLA